MDLRCTLDNIAIYIRDGWSKSSVNDVSSYRYIYYVIGDGCKLWNKLCIKHMCTASACYMLYLYSFYYSIIIVSIYYNALRNSVLFPNFSTYTSDNVSCRIHKNSIIWLLDNICIFLINTL